MRVWITCRRSTLLVSCCSNVVVHQEDYLANCHKYPSIKTRMSNMVNGFVAQCEISLNVILNDTLDHFRVKLQSQLAKQKKRDFNCNNIEDDTEACELVSNYLVEIHSSIVSAMNGANLERY